MPWPCRSHLRSSLAAACVLVGLAPGVGPLAGQNIAVAVNSSVSVAEVTIGDLNNYFTFARRSWPGGQRVTLFLPAPGSATRGVLLKQVYHMDDSQLRRFLLEKVYQGDIDAQPRVATSDAELVGLIASTPGSVTLLPVDLATAAKLKILKVNSKAPGETGYLLRP